MEGDQQGENNQNDGPLMKNTLVNQSSPEFFRDKDTADVYFLFEKDNKRVAAHKIILATKCDAFKAMFYGGVNEKGDVRIVDVSSEAFITFLRFFYFVEVAVPIQQIGELMYLADKYLVTALKEICYQYLEHHVPVEHICTGYESAIKYNLDDLASKFKREMKSNHEILFKSDSFRSCPSEILKRILEMDQLIFNCDAQDVFEACVAWAKNACTEAELDASKPENWKQQLGECFYLIPFNLMKSEQIYRTFDEFGHLFDHKETLDLMTFMAQDEVKKPTKFKYRYFWSIQALKNSTKKRFVKKQEIFNFEAYSRCIAMRPFMISHENKTVDKLTLSGTLEIFEDKDDDKIILLKQNVSFECSSNIYHRPEIKFANAINVEEGKVYKIQFDFDSSWGDKTFAFLIAPEIVAYCTESISDVHNGDECIDSNDESE